MVVRLHPLPQKFRNMLFNVDYHITDICNLNCAHCSHYCPLVKFIPSIKHKSVEQITADLTLLSKHKDYLERLGILGGEPCLHPQLSKILRIARGLFPKTKIVLTTNGTLTEKYLRWKDAIEENDIQLCVTLYPFKGDEQSAWQNFKRISDFIPSVDVWAYPTQVGMTYHQLAYEPCIKDDMDREEKDKLESKVFGCYKRWQCNQLKDGKLWICHYAAYLDILEKVFPNKVNIGQDAQCYLDLNNDNLTEQDIYQWQCETYPKICKHCTDVQHGGYVGEAEPWRRTKYDISEWVE